MDRYQFKFPPLYFLHIPKTAGTSLKWWLYDFYPSREVLGIQLPEQLEQVSRAEINQAQLITGHFGWQLFHYLDQPRLSITWLRDPVKRALSNFRYTREQFPHLVAEAKNVNRPDWIEYYEYCNRLSLSEMIHHGMYEGFVDNLQTRHLANWFPDNESTPVTDSVLERAKQNLASMSFVGLSEWMTPSIDLCCYQLGFPHHPLRLKYNVTSNGNSTEDPKPDSGVTPKCKALLREVERYDRQLYDFAQTRFQEQFSQYWIEVIASGATTSFPSLLANQPHDSSRNTLAEIINHYDPTAIENHVRGVINQRFHDLRPDVQLAEEGTLDFNDAILLDGWHPRWPGKEEGTSVRWAGPNNCSTVMFPFKPGHEYEVFFDIYNHAGRQFIENMSICVNGNPVPSKVKLVGEEPQKKVVWFLVPECAIGNNGHFTEVSFQVPGEVPISSFDENLKMSFATTGFHYQVSAKDRLTIPAWINDLESFVPSRHTPNSPRPTNSNINV